MFVRSIRHNKTKQYEKQSNRTTRKSQPTFADGTRHG